ncbi:excalibur calcium-binding domain-containing protein [Lentzea sp. NBC_00516]|uniref:excalibur calcium-binding domain-containing protein n=1 Tax=Lentzea sp. NBC_00516 TaxID=2903582 RepID=UPI002E8207DF|nr:excalibur calcium-binding domain-containing protein [Lentzea sp. NBC_00516]WUD21660.1 excalibur calcium-binding domain-containing protein [Lentzea sp. NBC_00516]
MTVFQQLSRTAAIAAGFLLVVSACGSPEPAGLAADLTTTTTTTTSSAVTTTTPPPVTVESIVDGRTAMLSNGTKVVLSGLAQPGECWAASAVEFATKTLVGKPVQVAASRLLLADGTDYAVLAVGQGTARAIAGADTAIQVAETAAKRATMGFWGPSCGGLDVKPAPAVAPPVAPQPQPQPQPQPAPPAPAQVRYANCTAVKAAGAAPLYRGQPGYSSALDRDGDGVACEK